MPSESPTRPGSLMSSSSNFFPKDFFAIQIYQLVRLAVWCNYFVVTNGALRSLRFRPQRAGLPGLAREGPSYEDSNPFRSCAAKLLGLPSTLPPASLCMSWETVLLCYMRVARLPHQWFPHLAAHTIANLMSIALPFRHYVGSPQLPWTSGRLVLQRYGGVFLVMEPLRLFCNHSAVQTLLFCTPSSSW